MNITHVKIHKSQYVDESLGTGPARTVCSRYPAICWRSRDSGLTLSLLKVFCNAKFNFAKPKDDLH